MMINILLNFDISDNLFKEIVTKYVNYFLKIYYFNLFQSNLDMTIGIISSLEKYLKQTEINDVARSSQSCKDLLKSQICSIWNHSGPIQM